MSLKWFILPSSGQVSNNNGPSCQGSREKKQTEYRGKNQFIINIIIFIMVTIVLDGQMLALYYIPGS